MTIEELEEQVAECFAIREEVITLKEKLADLQGILERKQQDIACYLEELGKASYHSKAGVLSFKDKFSYRLPKDPEKKKLFLNYLEAQGILEEMITVNSRTLNAWANNQIESLNLFDMEIPGLEKSEVYKTISMRKA